MTPPTGKEDRRRLTLELSRTRIEHLDALKREWGLRNRGDVLERLFDGLFPSIEKQGDSMALTQGDELGEVESDLDEQAALVLVGSGALERLSGGTGDGSSGSSQVDGGSQQRSSAGIDLPGFVRK